MEPSDATGGRNEGPLDVSRPALLPALVPVVVQDADNGDVLMLAYADREALGRALSERCGWYFSRSRARLWRKGEGSGNTQQVCEAFLDCDGDAVLLKVLQKGAACHTGERSCFHRRLEAEGANEVSFEEPPRLAFLSYLEEVIARRAASAPQGSYTASLLAGGRSRILQKVGEEAVEFILAASAGTGGAGSGQGNEETRAEAADLLFHLLVALRSVGLTLEDVAGELEKRHGPAGARLSS